jgi:ligand-binding SRPBCC domain-containing protein
MRRPALAPAPGFALRAILGEFAETLLASQLVIPQRARAADFRWSYPRLEEAIQTIVNPSRETKLLRTFASEQIISAPPERVFAFFSDPRNLQAITPPSLRFDLKSDVRTVTEGTTIDYVLRLHGVPLSWKTLIARWEPPHRFVDVQLHGPYALWEHEHTFTQVEGGVRMEDRVTYVLPFQPLGGLAEPFVRRDVEEIFRFRARTIAQAFQ